MLSPIEKSIHTADHRRLAGRLREIREEAGLSQTAMARAIGSSQSHVAKYEAGERRLDLVQVREVCRAAGVRFSKLAAEFD